MSRSSYALLSAMLCCLLTLSCGPRRISGSWELGSESKVALRQDSTAEIVLRARFNETWEQLPRGQRYLMELEGKRLSGWDYMGDKKPCTVSLPAGQGFSELPAASASLTPQFVELEEVQRLGEDRTFLRLSACDFWEKIMMSFGEGALGFSFGREPASRPGGRGTGVMYRKRGVGSLTLRGRYRFTDAGNLELLVPRADGGEAPVLRLRLSGANLTVLADGAFIPEDVTLPPAGGR